jgi:PEP-CTERM/exosortase A-associated glycosyltransferase
VKILHILDHSIPLHSGYTFRTRAILERQREMGWQTVHVTSAKHELGMDEHAMPANQGEHESACLTDRIMEEDVDGFHFYRTRRPTGIGSRLPVMSQLTIVRGLAKRVDEVVLREQPDILHAHSPALNGLAALWVGRKRRLPVVYEVRAFWEDAAVDHGTCREGDLRYRMSRALENYILHHADAVTTICDGLRSEIVSRGVTAQRVSVIPNAVDLVRFPVGTSADQGLIEALQLRGKQVLGFVGSFYAYEGLTLLLQALPMILERRPDVRLLLVGGGPQEGELKQLATTLGIADKVVFVGRVPHEKVRDYYDLVDVLVYPRLSMRLTELVTPLKPLEAMAQGKLVAASDVGGHRELIGDGVTGVLFKSGKVEELAIKVIEVLEERYAWPRIKESARRFVEEQRNWRDSVARYENVYQAAISGHMSP